MELAIQRYLRKHGLEKTVDDFKLIARDYPHKVLLKYSQIESNFTHEEVRDARGIVLEKRGWNVMSLAFRKFFNIGEGHAAPIDWKTARVFKKMDGSLIHAYFDYVVGKWCFGTTGTAEGEGSVDNFHYGVGDDCTFSDLFIYAFINTSKYKTTGEEMTLDMYKNVKSDFVSALREVLDRYKGLTISFELCTQFNVVVTPHTTSRVHLLSARNMYSMTEYGPVEMKEMSDFLNIPLSPTYDLKNHEELLNSFIGMPYADEGYVVCDANFNRVKLKNPAYLTVHHLKDENAFWRVIDIVRSGEIAEFSATFPHRMDELNSLDAAWNKLQLKIHEMKDDLMKTEEYKNYIGSSAYKEFLLSLNEWKNVKTGKTVEEINELKAGKQSVVPYVSTAGETEVVRDPGTYVYWRFLEAGKANGGTHRRDIAVRIQKESLNRDLKRFAAYFFSWITDPEFDVKGYLRDYDGKDLYEIFGSKNWQ